MSAVRTLGITGLSILSAVLFASAAQAQTSGFYQPVSPYPVEMGHWQHHSSTALESALRGRAAMIQALGNYRVQDSQARILEEQARSLYYDNDVKKTETLYRKKYLWRQHREEERARQISRDTLGKQLLAQRQATYYNAVYRLTPDELNRVTGQIVWPTALEDERYASGRRQLSFLFRQRARHLSGSVDPFADRILKLTEQLKQDLKQQIVDLEPSDYSDAQKFVRGLIYEVEYPTPPGARVAANI